MAISAQRFAQRRAAAEFAALAERFEEEGVKALSRALDDLHAASDLWQGAEGRLRLADSDHAAKSPPSI